MLLMLVGQLIQSWFQMCTHTPRFPTFRTSEMVVVQPVVLRGIQGQAGLWAGLCAT